MAQPLRWNTPAFRWSAPNVLWNGQQPSKTMPSTKVVIDFSGYSADELGTTAQAIHDSIVANAALFPNLPFTMVAFQATITDYMAKNVARASKATSDILAFAVARHELEDDLNVLGNYINSVANGDPMTCDASGFPTYTTGNAPDPTPPAAPTDLRLRQGDLSGSVIARWKADRARSMNQVYTCIGDPNVEANWKEAGLFGGGKAVLSGIVPGTTLWVRVRTAGIKGVMGAWSDPAKIMVV